MPHFQCTLCPHSSLVRSNFKFLPDGQPICVTCWKSSPTELFDATERMRINSAWYWRRAGDDRLEAWEFLQYGKPDHWWLQREYMEIAT